MKRECLTKGLRLKPIIVPRYFSVWLFSLFVMLLQLKAAFQDCYFIISEKKPVYLRLLSLFAALRGSGGVVALGESFTLSRRVDGWCSVLLCQ